jgi:hypothetical protein
MAQQGFGVSKEREDFHHRLDALIASGRWSLSDAAVVEALEAAIVRLRPVMVGAAADEAFLTEAARQFGPEARFPQAPMNRGGRRD